MVSSFFVLIPHQTPFQLISCSRKERIFMDIISGMNFELLQFVGISLLCEYTHSIRSFHLYKKSIT